MLFICIYITAKTTENYITGKIVRSTVFHPVAKLVYWQGNYTLLFLVLYESSPCFHMKSFRMSVVVRKFINKMLVQKD